MAGIEFEHVTRRYKNGFETVDGRPLRPAPSGSAAYLPLARFGGLGRARKAYGW